MIVIGSRCLIIQVKWQRKFIHMNYIITPSELEGSTHLYNNVATSIQAYIFVKVVDQKHMKAAPMKRGQNQCTLNGVGTALARQSVQLL
jgi:hypothetical protein